MNKKCTLHFFSAESTEFLKDRGLMLDVLEELTNLYQQQQKRFANLCGQTEKNT
jgi:hypothetical protein